MKKHSGIVLEIGILVLLFGILLMGTVGAASGMISGSPLAFAGAYASGIAQGASDISFAVILIGAAFLGLGLFMRTGSD
ncbi:hypothetical protein L0Y65_05120 [Candidatus Micrarchaeota archaeon]|nr:hypothetical protein [Candidatus Micrarchaeota archaeon]